VLDLLSGEANGGAATRPLRPSLSAHFYGVMPQVVAAWCRRRGHEVRYAT
jgi:hypothetical protein